MRGSQLIINDLRNSGIRLFKAVIRLLSGFPVLLASLVAHVRTNPRNLLACGYRYNRGRNAFPDMGSADNLKLTKRNAVALAKYADRVNQPRSLEAAALENNDKVALITGPSTGIGRATSDAFAARGANVARHLI
jgi:hypothetical protein